VVLLPSIPFFLPPNRWAPQARDSFAEGPSRGPAGGVPRRPEGLAS
jgi:hypothetical protein